MRWVARSGRSLLRAVAAVDVEVEVHELFPVHLAGAAVAEAELLEELQRRLALDERVQRDLQVIMLLAPTDSRLHQLAADAAAADVAGDAQSADLGGAFLVVLHADHP